ncbi:hypothetical protein EJ06DRAFT_533076 [Trichodelitschia bisporula]|uniref:Uncharacterized protein n=1 Tax=Trichodelitschia bisporula TaxID=703511 RepID=A0A6G1HNZ5_9PEZI|nr:hypothetical protein EJ06DRAFT_533076 [Trichodelitschia bisporula]
MALPPDYYALKSAAPSVPTVHTIELYLDYVCPFSKKMFQTLYPLLPKLRSPPYADKLQILFRPQIQPWHPSSLLVHEAALAFSHAMPGKFWEFSAKLFEVQEEYFDEPTAVEPREATYRRLVEMATKEFGVGWNPVWNALTLTGTHGNEGNFMTNEIKVWVKRGRQMGIHVSPTVVVNGVIEDSISSSWTQEQWLDWLAKNVLEDKGWIPFY